jgi:hypothetical protein
MLDAMRGYAGQQPTASGRSQGAVAGAGYPPDVTAVSPHAGQASVARRQVSGASDDTDDASGVPRRKAPSLDDLLATVMAMAPRPVARGFADALKATKGWQRVGDVVGDLAGLARAPSIAGAAGVVGTVARAVGPIGIGVAAVGAIAGLMRAAESFAEFQNNQNRRLGGLNPGIAAEFARASISQLRRDFTAAAALSGTTITLSRAVDSMRDAQLDFSLLGRDLGNRVGGIGAELVGGIAERNAWVPRAARAGLDWLDPDGAGGASLGRRFGNWLGDRLGGAAVNDWLNRQFPGPDPNKDNRIEDAWLRQLDRIGRQGQLHPQRNLPPIRVNP